MLPGFAPACSTSKARSAPPSHARRTQPAWLIKGNKPLAFRYHKKARAILYSSLEEHLDEAIGDQKGWRPLDVGRMTMLVFDTEALAAFESHPVRFRDIRRDPARQEEEAP